MALALLPIPNSLYFSSARPSSRVCRESLDPMDQASTSRISLPSISSLIEAANEVSDAAVERSPKDDHVRRVSGGSQGHSQTHERPVPGGSPRTHPPPTPPLPPASSFDFPRHSPLNHSPTSTSTASHGYYGQAPGGSNPELYAQRNSSYPPIPEINQWPPSHQPQSPMDASAPESLGRIPMTSYPEIEVPIYSGLSQQRPLPANFPPPIHGQSLPPIDPQMAPTWQHHHYFPPNAAAQYTQNPERYICQTCNKPFSRPSSLKIHTYSHTGEKPYKCKHEGCGKYFSVRSNMKRHEKGCHGGESSSTGGNSPRTA